MLLSTPGRTLVVAAERAATLAYPVREAVTWTVIRLPTWASTGFRVVPVAPAMATPFALHW